MRQQGVRQHESERAERTLSSAIVKKTGDKPVFFSITMEWDENPRSGRERNYLFTNNSANKIYIYYSENLTYNEPKNEVSDLYNEEKDVNMK